MERIYFDHNATTPMNNKVVMAMSKISHLALNASSPHYHGRYARKILENARANIKKYFSLHDTHELVFTSGCTESNNLVLSNFLEFQKICSCIEHQSITNLIDKSIIPVNNQGIVNTTYLEKYLAKHKGKKILLSLMYANNEIGTIQPIQKIAHLTKQYNVIFHCDITQAIGKINIDSKGIDLITFSSHKFGGPLGSGALIYKKSLNLFPMLIGGGQEFGLRSGTPNITAIHGMNTAFTWIDDINHDFAQTTNLKQYLEQALKRITKDVIIFGENTDRLPNTSSIAMPNVSAETQLIFFDLHGISLSAGSACSSGKIHVSKIQVSMGYSQDIATNSIRVSLGAKNTIKDIDAFINLWETLYLQK